MECVTSWQADIHTHAHIHVHTHTVVLLLSRGVSGHVPHCCVKSLTPASSDEATFGGADLCLRPQ